MYDKKCDGELNMPFYRASYDRSTGQSPNSPREQVILHLASFGRSALNMIVTMLSLNTSLELIVMCQKNRVQTLLENRIVNFP